MARYDIIEFSTIGDDRGSLIALEAENNVPFEIKRVYYIFKTQPDVRRGFHAHKKLKQLLVCVKGSCTVLVDDGSKKENIILKAENKGLIIEDLIWHEMFNFSDDCVLMVLADDYYDESDYIRNYDNFLKEVNK